MAKGIPETIEYPRSCIVRVFAWLARVGPTGQNPVRKSPRFGSWWRIDTVGPFHMYGTTRLPPHTYFIYVSPITFGGSPLKLPPKRYRWISPIRMHTMWLIYSELDQKQANGRGLCIGCIRAWFCGLRGPTVIDIGHGLIIAGRNAEYLNNANCLTIPLCSCLAGNKLFIHVQAPRINTEDEIGYRPSCSILFSLSLCHCIFPLLIAQASNMGAHLILYQPAPCNINWHIFVWTSRGLKGCIYSARNPTQSAEAVPQVMAPNQKASHLYGQMY